MEYKIANCSVIAWSNVTGALISLLLISFVMRRLDMFDGEATQYAHPYTRSDGATVGGYNRAPARR